jgi:hypothetical protein
MLDSGATAVFINKRFITQYNILRCPLTRPITLHNINGFINKAGSLTYFIRLTIAETRLDAAVESNQGSQ